MHGKFDSALDEAIYGLSLDGGADEEVGSSTEAPGTWAGLMRDGDELATAIERDRGQYPNVKETDLKFLRKEAEAGAIMLEDSQGGVTVKYYRDKIDLNRDWAECEKELSVSDDEFEANARRRPSRHRRNASIADRRKAGIVEGLTKEELDSLTLAMPTFDWKQIGGDMNPGAHGGIIAAADGERIELLEIQPVREHVGDREAAEVGFPFWTKEASYDLDDLDVHNKDVQSAIESTGLGEYLVDLTPEQRTVAIAEACLQYGYRTEEGTGGWAKDAIGIGRIVKWQSGTTQDWEYIADEDDEFRREVLNQYAVTVDGAPVAWFDDEEDAVADAEGRGGENVQVEDSDMEVVWPAEDEELEPNPEERLPKAYNQYGSSMGRSSDSEPLTGKVRLARVRLDSGGYDNGGAYWGSGAPLWRAEDADGREKFFRAADREKAKAELPGCTFYRNGSGEAQRTHRRNGMTRWHVFLNNEIVDTVYFSPSMDAQEVKRSLVDHDGYDSRIEVHQPPARRSALPGRYAQHQRAGERG